MIVVNFFRNLINGLGSMLEFINKPLGEVNEVFVTVGLGSVSIVDMFSVSLVTTLTILLVVHAIRLFIGG